MNEILKKRRNLWYKQNIKYLRYVFNDHFVLFLMILLGALVVQYINFLQIHQLNLWGKIILVILISLASQIVGRLATFIESPDKVFFTDKRNGSSGIFSKMFNPLFDYSSSCVSTFGFDCCSIIKI